ncbi:hypothetical protein BKH46_04335 [Helicobacter sp. 12S02634-8]|uniref:hypothetical protein n=1 Tax=Helicobacter sp. 12S02634-8 TaxID=1476199 RepID=UPI000BA57759|nr:hypothetical protein [Helicobacter sp. 12S02634-8]PAF47318.1 hypothetical protein BKH46_04335 [Helicobacter sp. 12S02634-8]
MGYFAIFFSIFLGLCPLIYLLWRLAMGQYGAAPIEVILHFLGLWGIYFLLGILVALGLGGLLGQYKKYRKKHTQKPKAHAKTLSYIAKILGLYGLFYTSGHIFFYVVFIQGLQWGHIINELLNRIYLFLGLMGFLCLVVLGIFSIFFSRLFRYVSPLFYLAGLLGSIHYLIGQKIPSPSSYAIFLVFFAFVCVKLLEKNKDKQ